MSLNILVAWERNDSSKLAKPKRKSFWNVSFLGNNDQCSEYFLFGRRFMFDIFFTQLIVTSCQYLKTLYYNIYRFIKINVNSIFLFCLTIDVIIMKFNDTMYIQMLIGSLK